MDSTALSGFVGGLWDEQIVPQLVEYIRIPNKSPMFDAQWVEHGHMDRAVALMEAWARAQPIPGMKLEVVRLPGRTPLIFIEIPGTTGDDTVLLYGHLDKQPEMTGWSEHLGPWKPVLEGDRLYGRGGADDGYAIFGSLAAIMALQAQGIPHSRCVVMIEACEESGSYDLPYYVDHLAARIGKPSLVVCLDSGCGNYEQLWLTTSLRGLTGGNLIVKVLDEGVHSGDASGVVASSFRILRQLLSRLEDEDERQDQAEELYVEIPAQRVAQAKRTAEMLGDAVYAKFPLVDGMQPMASDLAELVLNRTWRPALSITGVGGLPALDSAGNVLRPFTAVKLSLRVPPTLDAVKSGELRQETARERSAVRRQGQLRARESRQRLECAGARAVAREIGRRRLARVLRRAGGIQRRGRLDPVHGHARRKIPGRAVPDHRRARPALECARPERIPAHSDRQAHVDVRRARGRRSPSRVQRRLDARHRGDGRAQRQGRRRLLLKSPLRPVPAIG